MSEIEKLKKRITELESEVARLKAMPPAQHLHYHYPPVPYYIPQPTWAPQYPQIVWNTQYGLSGNAT